MKNKLKNYLKLGILLCVVSFTSCQKDDTTINEQQSSKNEYKVVLLEDIPNLIPVVNNVKRVQPKPSAATNRDGIEFIGLENVNTKNIIKITNETQKSTYTFRIDDPNTVGVNFENLHLIQVDNGYLAYIMSYQPDENWYNSTYTPEGEWVFDMSTYQGDITKYNLQREIIWSTNTDNSSARSNTITCTYSIFAMCDISYDHIRGSGCTGNLFYKAFRNCVASGGGGGNDTDPNDPDGNNTGGGGGSSSTVIPPCIPGADGVNTQALSGNFVSDQGEVEQETTAQCVENNVTTVAISALIVKFERDLSPEQKAWWNNTVNEQEVNQITDYLNSGTDYTSDKEFAKQAIQALMNDFTFTSEQWLYVSATAPEIGRAILDITNTNTYSDEYINEAIDKLILATTLDNIINLEDNPTTIDSTAGAVFHYYFGNGEAADIGIVTRNLLRQDSDYLWVLNRLQNGTANSITDVFAINFTFDVFHIGNSNVEYATSCSNGNCTTTFTAFANDSFSDPFDIGVEDIGGTPYNYIPYVFNITYPNPGYPE